MYVLELKNTTFFLLEKFDSLNAPLSRIQLSIVFPQNNTVILQKITTQTQT